MATQSVIVPLLVNKALPKLYLLRTLKKWGVETNKKDKETLVQAVNKTLRDSGLEINILRGFFYELNSKVYLLPATKPDKIFVSKIPTDRVKGLRATINTFKSKGETRINRQGCQVADNLIPHVLQWQMI